MGDCHNLDVLELNEGSKETVRLRLFFLVPLTLVIMLSISLFVYGFYHHHQDELESRSVRAQASATEVYRNSIQQNAIALRAIIDILEKNSVLQAALERDDRTGLLETSAPLFADLCNISGITHMYFTRPNRVNLLRVHQPEQHGDVIKRLTTLEAERTGATAQGVELGPLGTLTLRVVDPWYADKERKHLIGYVELGMEVDHALEEVRDYLGVQTYVLIRKQFLERAQWESGMRMMGRTPDWERFPDVVLSSQGMQAVPDELVEQASKRAAEESAADIAQQADSYRSIELPLQDAFGTEIGQLMILLDNTREADAAQNALMFSSITALAAGALLFGLFYWLVGRVGTKLEAHSRMLAEMAMRDGLTKLLNRRMLFAVLEKEAKRAQRYDRPLSLLMLDIDHFKRVNDTYGHVAGDAVLVGLSSLVSSAARDHDSVYRYGGEEISVVLPETGMEDAVLMAERIRLTVERYQFDIGQQQSINITVSIGVASLPAQETSDEKLTAAADKALYEAKQSGRNRVCRG